MTLRPKLLIAATALIAAPVYAQTVWYDMYLSGANRDTLILKVDTRELKNNSVIPAGPFSATLNRRDGTRVPQSYSIPALRSGKVYEWRKKHGIANADKVSEPRVSWAVRSVGAKVDGSPSLAETRPTEVLQDVIVAPPPPANAIAHCRAYSQTAIRQFQDAQRRQCGYSGSRWSPAFGHHYNWCTAVSTQASNSETTARSQALARCGGN